MFIDVLNQRINALGLNAGAFGCGPFSRGHGLADDNPCVVEVQLTVDDATFSVRDPNPYFQAKRISQPIQGLGVLVIENRT